jgi:hypothetical protein
MKYEKIKDLPDDKFRRICGMRKETFATALEVLASKHASEHAFNARGSGRKSALGMEDKLPATLEHLREHRTLAHVVARCGVAECAVQRTARWVEDALVKSRVFRLPGKKARLKSDTDIEGVLIDATQSPVERPQKNNGGMTPARKSATP